MQKACIVVPCYNESSRLNVNAFKDFIRSTEVVDLLFVNDGSSDSTLSILESLQAEFTNRISILSLTVNKGKAEAVRLGMIQAFDTNIYQNVGFFDADLATPLTETANLLHAISNKNIAISSRMKRLGATVERKGSRHLLGRVFSTFASLILGLPVYDTQCGAKLFSVKLRHLFEEKFITKWLFDIELLARFRNTYGMEASLNQIIELPVTEWREIGGSKLRFKHMLSVPIELLRIHIKYNKNK